MNTRTLLTLFTIICLHGGIQISVGQDSGWLPGRVTYVTPQNIYTEFSSTEGIAAGDTLFRKSGLSYKAVVVVKFLSSRSVAGPVIEGVELQKDDTLYARVKLTLDEPVINTEIIEQPASQLQDTNKHNVADVPESDHLSKLKPSIKGRASVQSSSSFVNGSTEDDLQRWRYTFTIEGMNTGLPGLSFRTYMNFAYNTREWGELKNSVLNRVQFYDINVSYTPDSLSRITAGRYINPKTSNIGAVDGIQYERTISEWNAGVFAGSRPSPTNYGFDAKLFQTGVYINRQDTAGAGIMENTLAAAVQTNNFLTDRRFLYFQHSSYLLPSMSLFLSSEADIYKNISGVINNSPELSSVYISIRNRIAGGISTLISYDARRNVMYYETYKNFIDSLFTNELRQGARASVSFRAGAGILVSLSGGYRFKKGDSKSSSNYSGFISYPGLPVISGTLSYNFTKVSSSYANADNHAITYRNEAAGGISYSTGYRYLRYNYTGRASGSSQNIVFGDVNWNFFGRSYLTLAVEEAFIGNLTSGRVYLDVTTRF